MRTTAASPAIDVRRFLIDERGFDIAVRYFFMIPLLLVAAAMTLLPSWRRWWQAEEIAVIATGWDRAPGGPEGGRTPARFLLVAPEPARPSGEPES